MSRLIRVRVGKPPGPPVDPPPASWQEAWDSDNQVTIDNWYDANTGYEAYFDTGLDRTLVVGDLTTHAGNFATSSNGQVIEKMHFTDINSLTIQHDDVTIRACLFDQQGLSGSGVIDRPTGTRFTVDHCTFRGMTSGDDGRSIHIADQQSQCLVTHCKWPEYDWVGSAAIRTTQTQGQGDGIRIEYCYIRGVGGGGTARATGISQRLVTQPHSNVHMLRCNIRGRGSACITMYNEGQVDTHPNAIMSNITWTECLFNVLDKDSSGLETVKTRWYDNISSGTIYATRFGQATVSGNAVNPLEDCLVSDCKWGRWSFPPCGRSQPILRSWWGTNGNVWSGNRFLTPGVNGAKEDVTSFNLGTRSEWFYDETNETWAYPT